MKNNLINKLSAFIIVVATILFSSVSCEKDDAFLGSPVGSDLDFITLQGSITTVETDVVASQSFPVTISLGDNLETPEADLLTFPVDVNVEAIAFLPNLNKRARRSFVIPAGQNSIESTMTAPSGDATTTIPFDFEMQLYLSAITTGQDVLIRGFEGKQYSIVSDTLTLGFGDTALGGLNAKRCVVRFDFEGPYSGSSTGGFNNLDIVFKKNGVISKVSSNGSTTRPIYGTTVNAARYETINFLDEAQEYKISNLTRADSIAGIYTIKSPNGTGANDKPHGFKVGDDVMLETIESNGSNYVAQIATVIDAYTCTFNYTGSHLFSSAGPSFYQPKIVPRNVNNVPEIWSPFLAYSGNESVVINSITYYAIRNVAVNPAGNLLPANDPTNWTSVKPKIDWLTAIINPPTWVAGTTGDPQTYKVNDVFKFNNVIYVCIKQHTITSGSPTPNSDTTRWTTSIAEYKTDVLNYRSTDTYTIDTFAKTLKTSPSDLRYKIAIRFPNGDSKVYTGLFTNLTVQPSTNAVPKLTIVKTTVQGESTFQISNL
jgi:hypothetical protein